MIVFLDVDGVLNSVHWWVAREDLRNSYLPPRLAARAWREQRLDPACVRRLHRLVEQTGVSIVLSSSWRFRMSIPEFTKLMALHGFVAAPVIGATLAIVRAIRGEEVAAWRAQHRSDCPYVCIDDDGDFLPNQPLVQTHPEIGLSDDDVTRCIAILTAANR
jgi:hypothetical protein